jgi:hypothetical protein
MKSTITLLTLAALSLSALAADVTGTWKAEFDTQLGLQKYTFTFKQEGASVSGNAASRCPTRNARSSSGREKWLATR